MLRVIFRPALGVFYSFHDLAIKHKIIQTAMDLATVTNDSAPVVFDSILTPPHLITFADAVLIALRQDEQSESGVLPLTEKSLFARLKRNDAA